MAWIESHQTLKEHPKLTKLAGGLGISKAQAIGHLHMLWWWCIDYADDGRLDGYTPAQIASGMTWEGSAESLLEHLLASGFVDSEPLRVHDWLDFCGDLIKKRLEYRKDKRRRTKRLRESLRKSENSQLTVTVPDRNSNQTVTIPNQPNTLAAEVQEVPYQAILEAYNQNRGILPEAKTLNDDRRKQIRLRWVKHPDVAYWKAVTLKLAASDLAQKWASLDWILANDKNHVKAMEGNYDNRRNGDANARTNSPVRNISGDPERAKAYAE